jgi:hypothetical protein
MRPITQKQLTALVANLKTERQVCLDELAKIEKTLDSLGNLSGGKRPGRPKGSSNKATKQHRPRKKFKTSGLESILGLVKAGGAKGVTSKQITQHWKKEGRSGGCYGLLGQLVKGKKLKKSKIPDKKGSVYVVAS